ncbi:MAG: molybdopterin-dependent oxidoreductase [Proteobacteria bacterium]|nr:molybdopterin-dependent oxidoreductase [Pseudomonadota bacterium]
MLHLKKIGFVLVFLTSVFYLRGAAQAAELTPFQGTLSPVTEAGYSVKVHGDGHSMELSISALEKLPLYKMVTKTIWNMDGEFVGVKLVDVVNHVGIKQFKRLFIRADDGYQITIERNDAGIENAILASRLNGKPFSLNNKGPFFIMWPDHAENVLTGKAVVTKWAWSTVEIQKIR